MTFEELIKEKQKRLDKIPLGFQTFLEKEQSRILADVMDKLNELSVIGGRYEITAANINTIASISEELKSALITEDYLKAVKEFAKEFDKQAILNDKIIAEAGLGEVENIIAAKAYTNIAKKAAIDALIGAPLDANFIKPIQSLLESAVVNGASYSDTLQSIRDFVEGGEGQDSKILKYAKQITSDSFAIADRSYTSIVADALDNDWFYFSGTVIAGTRCFCEQRVGHYFHYKEIESWARGENLGQCDLGDGNWAGEIQGTNESTIYSYLGGYNCLHFLIPVSESVVDEKDFANAQKLGYVE